MTRDNTLRQAIRWNAGECKKKLEIIWNSPLDLDAQVLFLRSVRDTLDLTCRLFRNGDDCETYAEWYLPLLDCLALLNQALSRRKIPVDLVREVKLKLEGLPDPMAAAAAV